MGRSWRRTAVLACLLMLAATGCARPPTPPATLSPLVDELPRDVDLEWRQRGDWVTAGAQSTAESVCLTQPISTRPGLAAIGRRDFKLRKQYTSSATVTVARFRDEATAQAAFDAIRKDDEQCMSRLTQNGATQTDQYPSYAVPVKSPAKAAMAEYSYLPASATSSGAGVFESLGVVVDANLLAFVVMRVRTNENYWSYPGEKSQLPSHPMVRTLPNVVERLRR